MPEEASCCRGGWSSPGQRRAAEKEGAWRGHTFSRLWGKELRLGVWRGGAPRGVWQPRRGSPIPDSCDPTALLTREMKHKWWRCGCGEVGMEPCVYVLNYFTLIYFILMICDLSGKEERLCEHRTKK